jgi:hypothetical protein
MVTIGPLTRFYIPVAANAALMMLSHAVNTAGLSRTPQAATALAAYSLGLAMAVFFEAPVLMLRQTVIALVRSRGDLRLLLRMTGWLAALLLVGQLLVFAGPGGKIIMGRVLGAPRHLWEPALYAFLTLAPLPAVSGVRCIYQGVVLYRRQPSIITVAMAARVFTMAGVVALLVRLVPHWGSVIGSVTFIAGLSVETLICVGYAVSSGSISSSPQPSKEPALRAATILTFAAPLVVLGLVDSVSSMAVNSSLARTMRPEDAMAAYALAWSVVAVLIGALQNLHQVVLIFGDEPGGKPVLRRFLSVVGGLGVLMLFVLACTPAGRFVVLQLLGAPAELAEQVTRIMMWLIPLPALVTVSDACVGSLLALRRSRMVAAAKSANILALSVAAMTAGTWAPRVGFAVGPIMMISGSLVETMLLAGGLLLPLSERRRVKLLGKTS